MKRLHEAVLHLGSNKGNRKDNLLKALKLIDRDLGKIIQNSSIYETQVWGNTKQADFLNQAVILNTELNPHDLLSLVNDIESEMGRIRGKKWGSRIIDIDILFYENEHIDEKFLKIPHPYIERRNFVLVPLNEIKSDYIHPLLNKSIETLLNNSKDTGRVELYKE